MNEHPPHHPAHTGVLTALRVLAALTPTVDELARVKTALDLDDDELDRILDDARSWAARADAEDARRTLTAANGDPRVTGSVARALAHDAARQAPDDPALVPGSADTYTVICRATLHLRAEHVISGSGAHIELAGGARLTPLIAYMAELHDDDDDACILASGQVDRWLGHGGASDDDDTQIIPR